MRWPCGPLDIARREKAEGFTAEARQTLERWQDPASLGFLKGSPVNCLVVSWAAGLPQDGEQQKALAPLIAEGARNGLSFLGWVEGPADAQAAIASAKAAGLAAVAIKDFKGKPAFPVVPWGERASAPWDTTAPVLPVTDNVWPGVQARGGATAGPTGIPWLDSNAWYAQLARARTNSRIWLMFDPPGKGTVVRPERYPLSIMDSEVAGARWVISLDDTLRAGLAGNDARALETWKTMSSTLSFFESHKEWRTYRRLAVVGVISDFAGANFDLSGEILNLAARRELHCRAIWKLRAMATPFAGYKALVYADEQPPAAALRQKLLAFVEQGGLLVTGPKWGSEGKPAADEHPRFQVRRLGKGRLAVAKEELVDAYLIASDVHLLLSHANDLLRFYNLGTVGSQYYASPDGKKALLQLVNYSGRGGGAGSPVTVWTRRPYRSGRLLTIGSAAATPVKRGSEMGGTAFYLPPMPSYAALEFEI